VLYGLSEATATWWETRKAPHSCVHTCLGRDLRLHVTSCTSAASPFCISHTHKLLRRYIQRFTASAATSAAVGFETGQRGAGGSCSAPTDSLAAITRTSTGAKVTE
jgi:hypothetical protein